MKKLLLIGAALLAPVSAHAVDLTFQGNFRQDNDVLTFAFSLAAPSEITVFSSSWLSGNPPFGFDPILTITDSDGVILDSQDDGGNAGSTLVNGVSFDHGVWDSYYTVALGAGDYRAIVAQFDNFPVDGVGGNVSSGFERDGEPNFTFAGNFGGATQPLFNGVWDTNDPRTSFWRFHLLNVTTASIVPAPGALALFGLGIVALGAVRRRG